MIETNKNKTGLELLAPAGTLDTLKAVIRAGADAVYFGGSMFGARAYAENFNQEEVLEAIAYGHIHNRKVILAVNTLLKNQELEEQLYDYLLPYYEAGLDAVIVQDYGVMQFIRRHFPKLPIHTSTQMTVTGVEGARFLVEHGAQRIVTAREMSLNEIRAIHEAVDVEIESFVHGALCYCYSGQCLFSSILGGRSGNRGRCAQPCRLPYDVYDANQKLCNKGNPYILSLKDLNTIEFLPEIAKSGVYSYKIEGRMKSVSYAAGVVSVYRYYMDKYLSEGAKGYQVTKADRQRLLDSGNRSGFTDGYYYVHNSTDMLTGSTSTHSKADTSLADAQLDAYLHTEIKEKIKGNLTLFAGSPAMIEVSDDSYHVTVTGDEVQTAANRPMTQQNIEQKIKKTGNTPFEFESLDISMGDNIFLPVAALNHLRKEALEQLEQLHLMEYKRACEPLDALADDLPQSPQTNDTSSKELTLSVSTMNREGLLAALSCADVSDIYLDSTMYTHKTLFETLTKDIDACHNAGKRAFYIMPAVFRARSADWYRTNASHFCSLPLDGYLVKSYDELAFLKECDPQKELRLDHNMYTFSDRAKAAFFADGIMRDTIPVELNKKELIHRNNADSEYFVYGYLPLMVSAGCVHKNTAGCDKKQAALTLKDRYQVSFGVRNYCDDCYNILYNAMPLFLLQHAKDWKRLGISSARIHFTTETREQANQILFAWHEAVVLENAITPDTYVTDYTNGHYKRGVL